MPISDRETDCLNRLSTFRRKATALEAESELLCDKIFKAVESGDNDVLNSIGLLPSKPLNSCQID